jgi:hypothetical protein
MRCTEFLEHYSDYRDGLIDDPALHRALRQHLVECRGCMRYDARIARGALVLRTTGDIEPSGRFRRRLRRRLATAGAVPEPLVAGWPGLMTGLMLTACLALAIWIWQAGTSPGPQRAAAEPTPPRLAPAVLAHPSVPFVTFTDLSVSAFRTEWRAPGITRTAVEAWGQIAP